jgi:hypothetical protein
MTTTQIIYEDSVSALIETVLDGFNGRSVNSLFLFRVVTYVSFVATVFAYGQTNSGKTFTMQGTCEQPGIIPLGLNHIFTLIESVRIKRGAYGIHDMHLLGLVDQRKRVFTSCFVHGNIQ